MKNYTIREVVRVLPKYIGSLFRDFELHWDNLFSNLGTPYHRAFTVPGMIEAIRVPGGEMDLKLREERQKMREARKRSLETYARMPRPPIG